MKVRKALEDPIIEKDTPEIKILCVFLLFLFLFVIFLQVHVRQCFQMDGVTGLHVISQ